MNEGTIGIMSAPFTSKDPLQGLRDLLEWIRVHATDELGASPALREKLEAAARQVEQDLLDRDLPGIREI